MRRWSGKVLLEALVSVSSHDPQQIGHHVPERKEREGLLPSFIVSESRHDVCTVSAAKEVPSHFQAAQLILWQRQPSPRSQLHATPASFPSPLGTYSDSIRALTPEHQKDLVLPIGALAIHWNWPQPPQLPQIPPLTSSSQHVWAHHKNAS